jgi:hypothetical protein
MQRAHAERDDIHERGHAKERVRGAPPRHEKELVSIRSQNI